MSTLQAVLFDADGVLQSGRRFFALVDEKVRHEQRTAFLEAVFSAEHPCLTGQGDFQKELHSVLASWRLESAVDAFHAAFNDIEVDEDVLRVVAQVRAAGVKCCVASNQQLHRARYMSTNLGYQHRFDHEFYSHELGVAKPDTEYFRRVVARLGLPAAEVMLIDDSAANVEAARSAGLAAEHFASMAGASALWKVLRTHGL